MADFEISVANVDVVEWDDPPDLLSSPPRPSRINPHQGIPHKRMKASSAGWIQLTAVVDGVQGPADGLLGGRLFLCWVVEAPTAYPTPVIQAAGLSSVADVRLDVPGHYTVVMRRDGGGAVVLHIDL